MFIDICACRVVWVWLLYFLNPHWSPNNFGIRGGWSFRRARPPSAEPPPPLPQGFLDRGNWFSAHLRGSERILQSPGVGAEWGGGCWWLKAAYLPREIVSWHPPSNKDLWQLPTSTHWQLPKGAFAKMKTSIRQGPLRNSVGHIRPITSHTPFRNSWHFRENVFWIHIAATQSSSNLQVIWGTHEIICKRAKPTKWRSKI